MKVKTSELEGVALDWAVARAAEVELYYDGYMWTDSKRWRPTVFWDQCGPLIERYSVTIYQHDGACAVINDDDGSFDYDGTKMISVCGDTVLIAACRAIVAAELGDEVDVPDEVVE